jgi:hypothetical protein
MWERNAMTGNRGESMKVASWLKMRPAAFLLSLAGFSLAGPALSAEVKYDPGDKVYFTYCYAHPPAARIKPGDSVITNTRDASNDAFAVSDKTVLGRSI